MPWSSNEPSEFTSALEKAGEPEVKAALARDDKWVVLEGRRKIAESWLRSKEEDRRETREIETLSIAKEANVIARRAARWAMYAAIAAVIALILTIISNQTP